MGVRWGGEVRVRWGVDVGGERWGLRWGWGEGDGGRGGEVRVMGVR